MGNVSRLECVFMTLLKPRFSQMRIASILDFFTSVNFEQYEEIVWKIFCIFNYLIHAC